MGSNPNGSNYVITHYKNAKGFIRWNTLVFKTTKISQKNPCNEITPGNLEFSCLCSRLSTYGIWLKDMNLLYTCFWWQRKKIPKWDIKNATYEFKNENWIFWRIFSLSNCFSPLFPRSLKPVTFHPLESGLQYLTRQHSSCRYWKRVPAFFGFETRIIVL